jgi:hypothetical protein
MRKIGKFLWVCLAVICCAWYVAAAIVSCLAVYAFGLSFYHGTPVEITDHLTGSKSYIGSGYYFLGSLAAFYFFVIRGIQALLKRPEPGPFEDTDLGAKRATRDDLRRSGLL